MKSFLVALVLAALVLTIPTQASDWGPGARVRIVTEGAYPPWNEKDTSGKLIGFEIDLAAYLCTRMKVRCEISARLWKGMIGELRAGEFDAIMTGVSITEKRRKLIAFSRAYAAAPATFAVRAYDPLASLTTGIHSVTMDRLDAREKTAIGALKVAFARKTIGVQAGTTLEDFLKVHMADSARIRKFEVMGGLDKALLEGKVDAAFAEASYLKPLLERADGELKVIGPGFTGGLFGAGTGIGVRHEDKVLADMFSVAIRDAIADGTISRLSLKWFGFDIAPPID